MRIDSAASIRRLRALLGLRGLAGVVMIVLAGLACMAASRMHSERQSIEQRISSLRHAPVASQADAIAAPSHTVRLEAVSLPLGKQQTDLLRQIEASAHKFNLAWSKVDYGHQALTDNGLATIEIKGVMKGPYPAIRDFLADVLSSQPSTALRSLTLARDSADSIDVEARIGLSIFLADGWLQPAMANVPPTP